MHEGEGKRAGEWMDADETEVLRVFVASGVRFLIVADGPCSFTATSVLPRIWI